MIIELFKQAKTAIILLCILTILTGIIYPFTTTLIAQVFFPWRANGSLLEQNGKMIGSQLIGQSFTDPSLFWGRPSATPSFPYNAENSSGSNLNPSNPLFLTLLKNRISLLQQLDNQNLSLIPIDLVTASASGLDPEISPEAALYQAPRIAKIRLIPAADLTKIINSFTNDRFLKIVGEPRVNVLQLNAAILAISPQNKQQESQ
jgi:K+-transporting ATPase ATPase C chain